MANQPFFLKIVYIHNYISICLQSTLFFAFQVSSLYIAESTCGFFIGHWSLLSFISLGIFLITPTHQLLGTQVQSYCDSIIKSLTPTAITNIVIETHETIHMLMTLVLLPFILPIRSRSFRCFIALYAVWIFNAACSVVLGSWKVQIHGNEENNIWFWKLENFNYLLVPLAKNQFFFTLQSKRMKCKLALMC